MFKNDFKILLFLIPAVFSLNCERDLSSSYNYGKTESINITAPKGGDKYTTGQSILIQWTSVNLDGPVRLELINDDKIVYSVNDVVNSGYYILLIPPEIIPSKNYLLKIASMIHPEVFDIIETYFEIAPLIDGTWFYSDLKEISGFQLNVELSSFIDNAFFGKGYFHLRYFSFGSLINYARSDTVGGTISYPDVNFIMREENGKEFYFNGQMINNSEISGRISGFIDSTYGNLNDTLTLRRQ